MPGPVLLKRAYEAPAPADGRRVLVDALWPRGVRKADAAIGTWLKEIAPSTGLRQWFAHEPAKWPEFRRRYKAELADGQPAAALATLRAWRAEGPLTLVFAAKDQEHNNAVVLREVLDD